jgi:hypothetical protein
MTPLLRNPHLLLLALSCAIALAPVGVFASGYENIGGYASYQQILWYYNPRYVTYPPTPGPEVAFIQYSETSTIRLFLGTHNCSRGDAGPIYEQFIGSWRPVRYYSSPTVFCMLTYSASGSGSFNGDLAWD